MAPFSDSPFQKSDRIMTGQKDAAIPDQPNMAIQKADLSGATFATIKAITKAKSAMTRVTKREIFVRSLSLMFGRNIF